MAVGDLAFYYTLYLWYSFKCLTRWKIVHQITSFMTTFEKELQLQRGAHSPFTHTLCRTSATASTDAPFLTSKIWPPPLWKLFRHLWCISISHRAIHYMISMPVLCSLRRCLEKSCTVLAVKISLPLEKMQKNWGGGKQPLNHYIL